MAEILVLVLCLVVLVALVWKPGKRIVLSALDERAERIRHELDEAARLREEAQALLARYQRQLHDGEAQANRIAKRAREEAERLEVQKRAEVEASIERRTALAVERIALEEQKALAEVRARAAELTILATTRLLGEHLDQEQANALIDQAIEDVGRRLAS